MRGTASDRQVPARQVKGLGGVNKKVVMAAGLIVVMVFMWGRLLFSGGSEAKGSQGNAMQVIPPVPGVQSSSTFERVDLPVIAGRNDVITHEMFTNAGWKISKGKKVTVASRSITEMDAKTQEMRIRQIAKSLELGAIIDGVKGEANEAFVDGELVSKGSKLAVRRAGKLYVFAVEDVMRDRVILKWNEFSIAVKMSEANDASNN